MLQHPNILPIYDAGEEDGHYYIVTEHVHGARTLAAYCRPDNLLPVDDVGRDHLQVRQGAALRARPRRHPSRHQAQSNIMLTTGQRRAHHRLRHRAGRGLRHLAHRGHRRQPVSYMSPEQVQIAEITNRSDLYSLGAVMYEMLTGFRPFRAGNLSKLLHQIVYATPPPIHTLRTEIPEELENVVAKALQKDPDKRYKQRPGVRRRPDARAPEAARTVRRRSTARSSSICCGALKFFHDFSHAEIWEVLRASSWQEYDEGRGDRQGRRDGRSLLHHRLRQRGGGAPRPELGRLDSGDCFGETSYVRGAKRTRDDQGATATSR